MSERRYSDREMNAIIKRAAALQQVTDEQKGTGSSIVEIQNVASELGIAPELVIQAAEELQQAQKSAGFQFTGATSEVHYRRTAVGTLTDADLPHLADKIRNLTHRNGFPRSLGNRFEWSSSQPDSLQINLTESNDKTEISLDWSFAQWIGLIFVLPHMLGFILGVMGFAELGPALGLAIFIILQCGCYVLARNMYRQLSEQRKKAGLEMAESLVQFVEQQEASRHIRVATQPQTAVQQVPQTLIG